MRMFSIHRTIASSTFVIVALWCIVVSPVGAAAQAASESEHLPSVTLDVLEGFVWSTSELILAPGQVVIITNRDVARHTFTVDEWLLDANLPSLSPVEVVVPEDVTVGSSFTFYSSIPGDREGGLEGTISIVSEDDVIAGISITPNLGQVDPEPRVRIEARDDFTFQPAIAFVAPGTIIEVVNTGVITHHFAIDDWNINQTIAPGALVLVRVPDTAEPGAAVDFYCSVPGHQQQGMVGVLSVTTTPGEISTVINTGEGRLGTQIDMRPFVPDETVLGDGWTRLRSGSSESILGDENVLSLIHI